jgi:hypothetical protein
MLQTDIIASISPYSESDSPTELHSDSTDSTTLLRKGALCWNIDESKMYVYLDTDDRDNVDMTAEDFTDATKYEYVIGRLPNSWYDAMDSGKSMAMNFLLVGQDGTDYTNQATAPKDKINSKKTINELQILRRNGNDEALSPTIWTPFFNVVENTSRMWDDIVGQPRLIVHSYIAQPKPSVQSAPLRTIAKPTEMIATNSHSVHQGAMIANAVSGKVSTADVVIGFESKGLEEGVSIIKHTTTSGTKTVKIGDTMLIAIDGLTTAKKGQIYKRKTGDRTSSDWDVYDKYDDSLNWDFLWYLQTQPTHKDIQLSHSSSSGCKAFTSLVVDDNNEVCLNITGEELVFDYDGSNTNITFDATLDETDSAYDVTLVKGENYEFFFETEDDSSDGQYYQFAGIIFKYIGDGQTFNRGDDNGFKVVEIVLDDGTITEFDGMFISNGKLVNESTGLGCTNWEIWSGNGTGDSGEFEQLTNGTMLDVNGNNVRTYSGIQRTGYYINEEEL